MSNKRKSIARFYLPAHWTTIQWLGLLYRDPEMARLEFTHLRSIQSKVRFALAVFTLTSLYLLLLLMICHLFIFDMLRMPKLESVEPGIVHELWWHTSEVLLAYAVSIISASALWILVKLMKI